MQVEMENQWVNLLTIKCVIDIRNDVRVQNGVGLLSDTYKILTVKLTSGASLTFSSS